MSLTVTIQDRTRFRALQRQFRARAAVLVEKTAFDVQAGAQSLARVDTGFMRASIVAEKVTDLHWTVTGYADYTIYNEFGTRFMSAQPMFRPTVERVMPSYYAAVRQLAAH